MENKENLIFSDICYRIFERATLDYHIKDDVNTPIENPFEEKTIEYCLYLNNWIDTVRWHLEDAIRNPDIEPVEALAIKRRIDKSNRDRTEVIELMDNHFLDVYKDVIALPDAAINTESPAWAISRLSILELKVYHLRQECLRPDVKFEHMKRCLDKMSIVLKEAVDLSKAIDQLLKDISEGHKQMKAYKQIEMHDDSTLNPVLYRKK